MHKVGKMGIFQNCILLLLLLTFEAYAMEDDNKFEFYKLPQELQAKIILDAFVNTSVDNKGRFLMQEQFYNNLLRLRKLNKASWQMIKKVILDENLKKLYFSGDILNKRFPKPLTTQTLIYAVNNNVYELAEVLLMLGANPKVWDWGLKRPIVGVASNQKMRQILLNYGAIENVSYSWDDEQLADEVLSNKIEKVRELIANGADFNAKYIFETTPLTIALLHHNLEMIKELTSVGADVNSKDSRLLLIQYINRRDNLISIEIVKELIRGGASIDAGDHKKNTALMYAAFYGYLEVVKWLINCNATVNAKNKDGCTALIAAAYSGHLEIVKELIKAFADVNLKTDSNKTALDIANSSKNEDIIKFLEEQQK